MSVIEISNDLLCNNCKQCHPNRYITGNNNLTLKRRIYEDHRTTKIKSTNIGDWQYLMRMLNSHVIPDLFLVYRKQAMGAKDFIRQISVAMIRQKVCIQVESVLQVLEKRYLLT